jgi:hypothetical protein
LKRWFRVAVVIFDRIGKLSAGIDRLLEKATIYSLEKNGRKCFGRKV